MSSVSAYDVLLVLLKQDIENNDVAALEKDLMRIPFEQLHQDTVDKLLSQLINATVPYESINSIKTIFDVWYKMLEVANGQLDHLTRLFCDITVSPNALQLVAKTYMDLKPIEYYMEHLIDYDSSPMTIIGAKNLEQIFKVDNHIWVYLFNKSVENQLTKGYTNKLIKDFIETKMVETSPPLAKPDWIINDYPTIPFEDELSYTIKHQCSDKVYQLCDNDRNQLQLIPAYQSSSNDEKQIIEAAYMKALARYQLNFDDNVFKQLGPSNVQMGENLLIDDQCHEYGGCRMLICVEYEPQYLNDDSVDSFEEDYQTNAFDKTEWFTGACDVCLNKIKYAHYAVRLPLWRGGWLGCYCSWDCVRSTLNLPNEIVTAELIDVYEQQLQTIGIQDRRYR